MSRCQNYQEWLTYFGFLNFSLYMVSLTFQPSWHIQDLSVRKKEIKGLEKHKSIFSVKERSYFNSLNLNIIAVKHEHGELFSNPSFRLSSVSQAFAHTYTHTRVRGRFYKYNVCVSFTIPTETARREEKKRMEIGCLNFLSDYFVLLLTS